MSADGCVCVCVCVHVCAVLEATESWPVPTLQGPLNLGSESLTPSPHEARALAVLTTHAATGAAPRPRGLSAGPQSGGLHTTTVLATGRRDGHVFLHVLLESVGPCWSHGTGSVRVDSGVSSGTGGAWDALCLTHTHAFDGGTVCF